jgi:hypothetical protein
MKWYHWLFLIGGGSVLLLAGYIVFFLLFGRISVFNYG